MADSFDVPIHMQFRPRVRVELIPQEACISPAVVHPLFLCEWFLAADNQQEIVMFRITTGFHSGKAVNALKLGRLARYRYARSTSTAISTVLDVKQGHTLLIDLENVVKSNITIVSQWQDHCDLHVLSSPNCTIDYSVDKEIPGEWLLVAKPKSPDSSVEMVLKVPEYINLRFFSNGKLDLQLKNKVSKATLHHCEH